MCLLQSSQSIPLSWTAMHNPKANKTNQNNIATSIIDSHFFHLCLDTWMHILCCTTQWGLSGTKNTKRQPVFQIAIQKKPKHFFDSECAVYYLTKHIWFLQHRPIIIGSILALSYSHPGCGMMGHDGGTRSSSTKGTTVYTCGKSAWRIRRLENKNPGKGAVLRNQSMTSGWHTFWD